MQIYIKNTEVSKLLCKCALNLVNNCFISHNLIIMNNGHYASLKQLF